MARRPPASKKAKSRKAPTSKKAKSRTAPPAKKANTRTAPPAKKAKSKDSAIAHRTRKQTRKERLEVRDLPELPQTFRCWFCIGEKRLGEKVPYSRTLPLCRKCQEHYTKVASERDTDMPHPTSAIPSTPSCSALPLPSSSPSSLSHRPWPTHFGFPSHPLRPAVVINMHKGLKKRITLNFKRTSSKKPDGDDPTSSNGVQKKTKTRAPRQPPKPILFLILPKPNGEDGGKILLKFRNPLRK